MLLLRGIAAAVIGGYLMLATSGQAALTDRLEDFWQYESDAADSGPNGLDLTLEGRASIASGLRGDALWLDGWLRALVLLKGQLR